MSSNIKIKRSSTTGSPTALGSGELAYSWLAGTSSNGGSRLYIGTGNEDQYGAAANIVVIGGSYFTDMLTTATDANTANTLVKRDASGNINVGTITASSIVGPFTGTFTGSVSNAAAWLTPRNLSLTGDGTATLANVDGSANVSAALTLATVNATTGLFGSSTNVPQITVDAKGRITNVVNQAITIPSGSLTFTGDVTGTGTTGGSTTLTLANTAVVATTYGSATSIPSFIVDSKGRITSATSYAVSSTLAIAGGTGSTNIVVGTTTLSFVGGTGVSTTVSTGQVSFAIGQAVATTSDVTFNNATINGTFTSNDITSSSISIAGDATITGNLLVQGTTTTINSTILAVGDINIVLAKDASSTAAANGAGLTVNGAAATLTYTSVDDRWNFNKNLNVGTVYGALSGNATTASTWATARNLNLSGDVSATLTAVNGSADVSATVSLVTVNSNIGSFGSSTSVPSFTVNGKGLITAASATAIPTATVSVLGLASFATTDFTVTAGAVSIKTVDGGTY